MKPVPTHIIASENQIHVFGLPPSKVPRDFTYLIKNFHTVEETDQIVSDILPIVMQLQNDEECTHDITFKTPRGPEMLRCTFIRCRISCIVITFQRK